MKHRDLVSLCCLALLFCAGLEPARAQRATGFDNPYYTSCRARPLRSELLRPGAQPKDLIVG